MSSEKEDLLKHKHVYRVGTNVYGEDEPPEEEGCESHRKLIEPWLSAVLQTEHLGLLIGSGFTTTIGFAAKAKVFHQESRSLNQATSQRLRWSSGRLNIAKTLGWRLMMNGIKKMNWWVVDASSPLIFPNYSLQINLTLVGLAISYCFLPSTVFFFVSFSTLLGALFLIFLVGSFIAGSPFKIFRAVLFAPFFLVWKGVIDVLCFTGLYQGKKWVRTRRH